MKIEPKIGRYLQVKDNYKVNCDDKQLFEKLNNILKVIKNKTENNELSYWNMVDFKIFFSNLSGLNKTNFINMYPCLIWLLNLSKDEAKQIIMENDNNFGLCIFKDDRKIKKENGITKYEYEKHIFNTNDYIQFLNRIESKISQFGFKYFFGNSSIGNIPLQKLEYIERNLCDKQSTVYNDLVNIYKEWYKNSSNYEKLQNFFDESIPRMIESLVITLRYEIRILRNIKENKANREFEDYRFESKNREYIRKKYKKGTKRW